MSKDFIVYVDLDSTLLDTWRFAEDFFTKVSSIVGVSLLEFKRDMTKFNSNKNFRSYDFAAHMRHYNLDIEEMYQLIDDVLRSENYLYDDSQDFLAGLREDGYEPVILTFGENKRFQTAKIMPYLEKLSGKAPIEYIVVSRKKTLHISELHAGERGVLVDDLPDQDLPTGFTEIHLHRQQKVKTPERKSGGFTVSSLSQARDLINSLSSI